MIRITTEMDKHILDYKIQRSMEENAHKVAPVEPTEAKRGISKEQPRDSYVPSKQQNSKNNKFQQLLDEEIVKIKRR